MKPNEKRAKEKGKSKKEVETKRFFGKRKQVVKEKEMLNGGRRGKGMRDG